MTIERQVRLCIAPFTLSEDLRTSFTQIESFVVAASVEVTSIIEV